MITDYIVSSGSFGDQQAKSVAGSAHTGGKGKRMIKLLFPSVAKMRYAYPVLQKFPVMLPAIWVYRWGKIAFAEKEKLELHRQRLGDVTKEKLDAFEQNMRAAGIHVRFEENET